MYGKFELTFLRPNKMIAEWQRGEYLISTDMDHLDLGFIHNFLSNSSYWAQGRDFELVKRSVSNSLNFGLYKGVSHPRLQGFRRWLLATRDAHELYRRFGFTELTDARRWMEKS